ncbi:MAG: hypothetical protein V4439_03975 [Patescibacteria group bacterium]
MFNSLANPKALGEVCKDLGQVFFASVFLTSLMGVEVNYAVVISGFILSIIFWSMYVLSRKNETNL